MLVVLTCLTLVVMNQFSRFRRAQIHLLIYLTFLLFWAQEQVSKTTSSTLLMQIGLLLNSPPSSVIRLSTWTAQTPSSGKQCYPSSSNQARSLKPTAWRLNSRSKPWSIWVDTCWLLKTLLFKILSLLFLSLINSNRPWRSKSLESSTNLPHKLLSWLCLRVEVTKSAHRLSSSAMWTGHQLRESSDFQSGLISSQSKLKSLQQISNPSGITSPTSSKGRNSVRLIKYSRTQHLLTSPLQRSRRRWLTSSVALSTWLLFKATTPTEFGDME